MGLKTVVAHELEVLKDLEETQAGIKRLSAVISSDVFELFPAVRQRLTVARLECDKFKLEMLKAISITHQ